MTQTTISIDKQMAVRFDGGDAANHTLSMRHMGMSMIGIERLVSVSLFTLENGRPPKGGQLLPMVVKASEPRQGSFELNVSLGEIAVFLPHLREAILASATEVMWQLVSGALLRMGGRQSDSGRHLEKALDIIADVESHRHEEMMAFWDSPRATRIGRNVVAPIISGSCNVVHFSDGADTDAPTTTIDPAMAETIRSKDRMEIGDMETVTIQIDGLTRHNSQLNVLHPAAPDRFITAYVHDPAFQKVPNLYTQAVSQNGMLRVTAKPAIKDGQLRALHIMDAQPVEFG